MTFNRHLRRTVGSDMSSVEPMNAAVITDDQFLLREMRVVCSLKLEGRGDKEIADLVVSKNLFQYPTERKLRKLANGCVRRIRAVDSDAIVRIVGHGEPEAAAQANLYTLMCAHPIVRDFMVNEIGRRFAEYDTVFGVQEMNAYITRLQVDHPDVAALADSTIAKIKQVLRKFLIECDMLASAHSSTLLPVPLDFAVRDAISAKGDIEALSAFGSQGVL